MLKDEKVYVSQSHKEATSELIHDLNTCFRRLALLDASVSMGDRSGPKYREELNSK